jgi:hypothetical protein
MSFIPDLKLTFNRLYHPQFSDIMELGAKESQLKVLILVLSNGPICERFLLSPVPPEEGGRYSL